MRLLVIGCLQCVAERGCVAGMLGWAHSVRLGVCRIRGHVIMMSHCIDMCAQEACEGGVSYFTVDKQGALTCISVLK